MSDMAKPDASYVESASASERYYRKLSSCREADPQEPPERHLGIQRMVPSFNILATWGTPIHREKLSAEKSHSSPRAKVVVQGIHLARRAPPCWAERWRGNGAKLGEAEPAGWHILYRRAGIDVGHINGSER